MFDLQEQTDSKLMSIVITMKFRCFALITMANMTENSSNQYIHSIQYINIREAII